MKIIYSLISGLMIAAILVAEANAFSTESRIRFTADLYASAIQLQDDATVASFTYPPLVRQLGGERSLQSRMAAQRSRWQAQQWQLRTIDIGNVSEPVTSAEGMLALVETRFRFQAREGELLYQPYFVAVSQDQGESWTFIDASLVPESSIRALFPDALKQLKLPAIKEPALVQ